ncbi:MAG: Smr/MutS family protein [Anaerolineales bacterium]|nr:Smr/MutS family protein [Anaerolineales bacterium]
MDAKTLQILEYPKILERLAGYCAFQVSAEKALALRPTNDIFEARRRQAETREALRLLDTYSDLTIGGARDIRQPVDLALHGGVLSPGDLLDVKSTLVAARNLARTFERLGDQYPNLADIAAQLPSQLGIIDAVSRAISERGEILDAASQKLAGIRHDLHIVHDRLMSKLQKIVSDPKNGPYLQEALITHRDGRYVVPLRAEFKGRIRSIVHDQSSSGATLFVEPLVVVEMNNQYRELQLAERDEERRILTELSRLVGEHAYEINHTVEVVAELDLTLARGKYAADLDAVEPKLQPIRKAESKEPGARASSASAQGPKIEDQKPVAQHPGSMIRLYQARHPLLDAETVVPIDVELEEQVFSLVITGPNTGGKTVTLKTIGLLALMAQAGLHVPVQPGSEISVFDDIFADIGDEQSIEQSLSTFSGHITNIVRILERADSRSLVILDELGAGTDPQEGAALARALLSHVLERGITTLVTTHHPELKAYAHATPGVVNASMAFDLETLRPTFQLTIGLPGRSNALSIAERLGLPDAIVAQARSEIDPQDLRAEDLLDEIHRQRDLARQARAAAELARKNAESLRDELLERLDKIEDERRNVLEEARRESEEQFQALQAEVAEVRRALARARQPSEALEAIEEQVAVLEETIERPAARHAPKLGAALERMQAQKRRSIRLGDRVRLRSLGVQGIVSVLSEEEAEVQVGVMRVRARLADLELAGQASPAVIDSESESPRQRPEPDQRIATVSAPESPGIELDLRGKRADEALDVMERYLDAAYLAGLPFVRIIHGKGTGKLRDVVRQSLGGHSTVRSFEPGGEREGGDGVTVVKLASA